MSFNDNCGGSNTIRNVAIKCTYNDGGNEGIYVGFNGTCTKDNIEKNIQEGRIWCNQPDCECRKYYDKGLKGDKPIDPCYESVLFKDWKYGGGCYHTGKRAGTPIHHSNVDVGKIAILTTRFPEDDEINRRIIGFFKIDEVTNNPKEETILMADKIHRIRLTMEEAKELYFWDYHSEKRGARWDEGLFRYLSDEQVVRILKDLIETLRDAKAKAMVINLLNKDFSTIVPSSALGPRSKKSGDISKRISEARKYGSGGEGADHKKLKDWVALNPKDIGLTTVKRTEKEYRFTCGDAADVVFELDGNKYAVVEIETLFPFPGCHQALKYKVLKCAELNMDIKSPDVEAILVAWSISPEVSKFCTKYGIRCVEKKL